MSCESIYVICLICSYSILWKLIQIFPGHREHCHPLQATTIILSINKHCNIYLHISVISLNESRTCTDPNDGSTICTDHICTILDHYSSKSIEPRCNEKSSLVAINNWVCKIVMNAKNQGGDSHAGGEDLSPPEHRLAYPEHSRRGFQYNKPSAVMCHSYRFYAYYCVCYSKINFKFRQLTIILSLLFVGHISHTNITSHYTLIVNDSSHRKTHDDGGRHPSGC